MYILCSDIFIVCQGPLGPFVQEKAGSGSRTTSATRAAETVARQPSLSGGGGCCSHCILPALKIGSPNTKIHFFFPTKIGSSSRSDPRSKPIQPTPEDWEVSPPKPGQAAARLTRAAGAARRAAGRTAGGGRGAKICRFCRCPGHGNGKWHFGKTL